MPADARRASASCPDPDISRAYAQLQVNRVAAARGRPADRCGSRSTRTPGDVSFGFIGEERVNVVELNLALQRLE